VYVDKMMHFRAISIFFIGMSIAGLIMLGVTFPKGPTNSFCLYPAISSMTCADSKTHAIYQASFYYVSETNNTQVVCDPCLNIHDSPSCESGKSIDLYNSISCITHKGMIVGEGRYYIESAIPAIVLLSMFMGAPLSILSCVFIARWSFFLSQKCKRAAIHEPLAHDEPRNLYAVLVPIQETQAPKERNPMPTHILTQLLEDATFAGRTFECPICTEKGLSPDSVTMSGCGHVYCKPCFTKLLLQTNPACGYCRAEL
jgi:hypothetical protein